MKRRIVLICIEVFLGILLIACNANDDYYRISCDEIYTAIYKSDKTFDQSFFIIENEDDLKNILKQYDDFLEQPSFNSIMENYPLEKYTIFINWARTNKRISSIEQKAVLIKKETNRVSTDCKLNFLNDNDDDIKYWVMYWVVNKDILAAYDFNEQKNEPYEYINKPNGGLE